MDHLKFYLVDGRYRISCASCASFLHAMSRDGDMSHVMVAMHDWPSLGELRNYRIVLDFAEVVHKLNALTVFKMKPSVTDHDVFKMWEKYVLDLR